MRKILVLLLLFVFALGCGSKGNQAVTGKKSKGELVGIKGKKYYPEKPFGMVLVPGGAYIMGKSDDDLPAIEDAPTKTVTVRSFYMDETEITNAEYRQFVYWVRDSVIRTELAKRAEEVMGGDTEGLDNAGDGIRQYAFITADTAGLSVYEKYIKERAYETEEDRLRSQTINWDVDLVFDRNEYPDEDYLEVMESFFIPEDQVFNDLRTWDVSKFDFSYLNSRVDDYLYEKQILIEALANDPVSTIFNPTDEQLEEEFPQFKRSNFITRESVNIYPDTTVWINDFKYSYNEPMHNDYFWHDAYSNYPVVGVTWHQANAFCQWRTTTKNAYQKTKKKKSLVPNFRLPTEAEWEYAARGGLQGAMYPWGGPYTKNDRGCFMANFKPMRGDYSVDQALYTVEANAYDPNGYNLYNMAGNVSEWVDSSYEQDAYEFSATMNPNVNNYYNNKKIIRGGSWKDVKYFLQVSTRDYEYQNQARSYIGFRTVHDYLGADLTANDMTNSAIRKQKNKRSSIK